ncbi:MAG: DUF1090 domain-containing protein [Patescibacteria group bacterium]|nr:DUF1090 domain-containing protein [Patescibacteria group bacterium]
MSNNKQGKIIISLLIGAQLALLPGLALAQIPSANPVPTSDSANGSGGIVGTGANATAAAALEAQDKINQGLANGEATYFKGDSTVQMGFGGLALISGGASVLAQLKAKITAIDGFILSRQQVRNSLMAIVTPNTYTATRKQMLLEEVDGAIRSLKDREEPIKQQLQMVEQGFWKTLVYNILIKTTKSVSDRLVANLTNKFKITNFSSYADAVATQVYDNQFIQNNYKGNNMDQMIVRSMLVNPLAQSEVSPAVYQRADAALGFDPHGVDVSDPNFYNKMTQVGSGQANPFLQQVVLADQANNIHSQALANAQAEVAQSSGLKTPRTCTGVLSQQQAIDQSYKAANNKLADRQKLLADLQAAQMANMEVNPDDIKQAQADVDSAAKELQALPKQVTGGAVDICKDIVSPPSLINKGIDEAFKSLGQNLGNYNENNMPFFFSFITDVANQISNNLIFGGGINSSQLLSENTGSLANATALGLGFASTNSGSSVESGIIFNDPVKSSNFPDAYTLSWEVITDKFPTASYVTIRGTGISDVKQDSSGNKVANKLPLSGSVEVRTSSNSSYTLKVYEETKDSSGKVTGTKQLGSPSVVELDVGSVKGAFIDNSKAEPVHPRGLKPVVSPRGQ